MVNISVIVAFIILFLIFTGLLIWLFLWSREPIPCPSYLSWLIEFENPFTKIHQAKTIIKNSAIKPGMTILDAGCGPGRVTIPAAIEVSPTGKVVAMDIQMDMLKKVQKKAEAKNLSNIEYLNASIGDNKLATNSFDRIVLISVLGEIPNQHVAVEELYKSLKPGGILSITETRFDPHFISPDTVRQITNFQKFREDSFFGNFLAYTMNLKKPG